MLFRKTCENVPVARNSGAGIAQCRALYIFLNRMSAKRPGFTLVELLIIVLVVGVLAAITMPKFSAAKDKAHTSAMKSDLRNFANYEEDYASANGGYFSGNGSAQGFAASEDVTVAAVAAAGPPATWTATATHAKSATKCRFVPGTPITCAQPSSATGQLRP